MNKRSGIESQKRIFSAAEKVFSEYGYARANMRAIAKESGMSIGGIYLYFKNKEDLFITLMKSNMETMARETREILKSINDPEEALKTFISIAVSNIKKYRQLILVSGRELGFTLGVKVKRKYFKIQRQHIEDIIQDGIRSDMFRKCNVEESAKVINCALRGYALSMVIDPETLYVPEEFSSLVLNGFLRRN
ncbi:MAG: TetR/AcrR family transcriptional regulator [Nitrospiraceae bacterium]|nr:TetR/AcrR family transcriptional regulator [Nitrospiraceae bacterium]